MAPTQNSAHIKWTPRLRLSLYILYEYFSSLTGPQKVLVFNALWKDWLAQCGFPDGIAKEDGDSKVHSQWRESRRPKKAANRDKIKNWPTHGKDGTFFTGLFVITKACAEHLGLPGPTKDIVEEEDMDEENDAGEEVSNEDGEILEDFRSLFKRPS